MVILFHSNTLLRFGYDPPESLTAFNSFFGPYRMPLLVFLSGVIVNMSLRKSFADFTAGKLRNLIWPYAIWTFVYFLTIGSSYSIFDHQLYGSYLWYLIFVFVYYFISLLAINIPRLPLILIAFTLAASVPADIQTIQRFFFLWGIFMLGEWLYSKRSVNNIAVLHSRWIFLGIIPMIIVSSLAVSGERILYETGWIGGVIAGIFVIIAVAIRVERFCDMPFMAALSFLGRKSIVYYTSHVPVIYITVLACAGLGVTNPWIAYFIAVIAAFTVGTILVVIAKTPVGAVLFTFPDLRRRVHRRSLASTPNDSSRHRSL
ncbi:hypothetical protein LTH96_03985 [Nesterenkonia sp. LB17]|nr:hypothetical protein [Nesterenkonia sp. LB17]